MHSVFGDGLAWHIATILLNSSRVNESGRASPSTFLVGHFSFQWAWASSPSSSSA